MSNDYKKVMQMALDAFEDRYTTPEGRAAIEALRAALATEQKQQEDDLSEIANLLPNCAVVKLDNKTFFVQPKTKESKQQFETQRKQIDGYFAVSQKVLAQPEQEPVGNTLTFMTRAIFNIVADHQEINGGYFIADGDVAAFVDRLAKVINSTFEPLKHKNPAPPQREWVGLTEGETIDLALSAFELPEVSSETREKIHRDLVIAMNDQDSRLMLFAANIEAKLKEKNG